MEQRPLITVAVTCYNLENYIERCLRSILAQTYKELEVLIVDDGSSDASPGICDRIAAADPRVRVLHTPNGGPGKARNAAIERAKGEYIAFVDGDDYIVPDMYETMVGAILKTRADIAVCRHYEVLSADADSFFASMYGDEAGQDSKKAAEEVKAEEKAEEKEKAEVEAEDKEKADPQDMVMDQSLMLTLLIEENEEYPIRNAVWNKLCKKQLLKRLRLPNQKYYEDILFTTRLIAGARQGVFVDRPLYCYVTDRQGSIMNQGMNRGIITDQIPSYLAKDAFLLSIGRRDLVNAHDYLVYKKLLLLYTEARRSKDAGKKKNLPELADFIRTGKERMDEIYSCRIADPHQKLRMKLFLIHPACYNVFMDINDGIILPLRRKIKASSNG